MREQVSVWGEGGEERERELKLRRWGGYKVPLGGRDTHTHTHSC